MENKKEPNENMAGIEKEYEMLRKEIESETATRNTLRTFMITTTVAVFMLAATSHITMLYLLAFCIIIPLSSRIVDSEMGMYRIGAYMTVFLEPHLRERKWETRLYYIRKTGKQGDIVWTKKIHEFIGNHDGRLLALAAYAMFVLDYTSDHVLSGDTPGNWFHCFWPMFLVVLEFYVTKKGGHYFKTEDGWLALWRDVKCKEDRGGLVEEDHAEITEGSKAISTQN